jgi:hypothetical protein
VYTEDSDDMEYVGETAALPQLAGLRLIALDARMTPARRRYPRRRVVASVVIERRRGDRRHAKPGIDGLLRTVLADDWT